MVRRAVRVWLVLALSLVSGHRAVAGKAVSKKATLCSQAIDCASCVQHQECYELPKPNKTTVCWPCGWCVEKGAWGADQAGTCARITDPSEDFCVADDSAPIDEDAYCSPSVCNVTTLSAPTLGKPSACACDYNVCPSVNLFLRLLRLEGFWVLVGLLVLTTAGAVSVCNTLVWLRAPPPGLVLVRRRDSSQEDGAPGGDDVGADAGGGDAAGAGAGLGADAAGEEDEDAGAGAGAGGRRGRKGRGRAARDVAAGGDRASDYRRLT